VGEAGEAAQQITLPAFTTPCSWGEHFKGHEPGKLLPAAPSLVSSQYVVVQLAWSVWLLRSKSHRKEFRRIAD